jgi:type II secretory pathway pseudopilin PulG
LGLIAGLTIPSVINSVNKARQKSMAKEALQVITDITSAMVMNGDADTITSWNIRGDNGPTNITGYLTSKLNAKQCIMSDITSAGCTMGWDGFPPNSYYNQNHARWILSTGARIQGADIWNGFYTGQVMAWAVDVNPYNNSMKLFGQAADTMLVLCNITQNNYLADDITLKPGQCGPWGSGNMPYFNSLGVLD